MRHRQKGLAILTFSMAAAALIPLFGTAMDGAMLCVVKQRLTAAVESAARSASNKAKVDRYLDANFPVGHLGTSHRTVALAPDRLVVSVDAPTYFLQLIHVTSVKVTAAAEIKKADRTHQINQGEPPASSIRN